VGVQGGLDEESSSCEDEEPSGNTHIVLPEKCVCQHCRLVNIFISLFFPCF
jgi:hypothetical protein